VTSDEHGGSYRLDEKIAFSPSRCCAAFALNDFWGYSCKFVIAANLLGRSYRRHPLAFLTAGPALCSGQAWWFSSAGWKPELRLRRPFVSEKAISLSFQQLLGLYLQIS
jgi:hypothetical protein